MVENSKPSAGARTLALALAASAIAHVGVFAISVAMGSTDWFSRPRRSGDVLQMTEFEYKPAAAPRTLTPDDDNNKPSPSASPSVSPAASASPASKPKPPRKPRVKVPPVSTQGVTLPAAQDGGVGSEPDGGPEMNADAGPDEAPADPDAPPPAASADLGPYAPGDARVIAILHADKLRGNPLRAGAEELLAALPDTEMILAGTGLNPFDDFDTIMVATADPADVSETFLAGRGIHGAAALKRALAGPDGKRVRWIDAGERAIGMRARAPKWDPRLYVVAGPEWMVFGRPEQLGALADPPAPAAPSGDAGVDDDFASDAGTGAAASPTGTAPVPPGWAKRLGQIRTVAGEEADGPALVLSVADLRGALRLPKSLRAPIPKQATLAVRLDAEGAIGWATIVFDDDAALQAFLVEWKGWRDAAARDQFSALLGVPALMDRVELTPEGARLRLRTRMKAQQVGSLLRLVASQVKMRATERIERLNKARGR
ncbi:MAG: hypothetical protein IT370_10955 [Deltaproteobacteria bacterium]|nr:hypothetical protein [Deltaproteobacteria bacterium]